MKSFQGKSKWQRTAESWPVLLLLSVLLVVFAWNVIVFVGKMRDTIQNRKIAEQKIKELEESREKLTRDIENLKTDQGVEESIRDKYGLGKEGEELIWILEDKEKAKAELEAEQAKSGFWGTIKGWFQ